MSKFLSGEWLDQAKAIRAEYEGQGGPPPHMMRMNMVITDVPADVSETSIDAHMDTTSGEVKMDLGHLESPDLTVEAVLPQKISGKARIDSHYMAEWPVRADIEIAGELRDQKVSVRGTAGSLPVTAQLRILPLDPDPLHELRVHTTGVDLKSFADAAPRTSLEATFTGRAIGTQSLAGAITAANALPGPVDKDALPVHALRGRITLSAHAIQLDDTHVDLGPAPSSCVVSDIVYVPLETALLSQARQRGLVAVDGLGMLLHQAVPGFERWFGVRPEVTEELRALIVADIEGRR